MRPPYQVLCFGDQWDPVKPSSSSHIALRLADGQNVLWINPLPLQLPSYRGLFRNYSLKIRIINKLKVHTKLFFKWKNIYVLSPLYLPLPFKKSVEYINKILLRLQVRLAIRFILDRRYIVYATSTYSVLDFLDIFKNKPLIFHYADMLSSLRHLPKDKKDLFIEKDSQILKSCDLVLCSSKKTMSSLNSNRTLSKNLTYFPHGFDFQIFDSAKRQSKKINEMEKIPKPIIGYFGSLTDANDKEAIRYCAEKRPEWSFVLIGGPVKGDYSIFKKYKNIYMLGKKKHEEIPHYGKYFNVGLMNWIPHAWILHSFPLKTLEYLALGLPIVSVNIEEIKINYKDFVAFASTPEEYLSEIEKCLKEDSDELKILREKRVKEETWDHRIKDLKKWIAKL